MQFKFKNLFGISAHEVKPRCVLMPFIPGMIIQQLGLSKRISGKPYASFQHPDFTILETRMGPLFNGDAVLNLKDTPCEEIFFIGSCGSLNEERFPIGTVATPKSCYAMESFTQMLNGTQVLDCCIQAKTPPPSSPEIQPVQCASVGSIILESTYHPLFLEKHIDVIEMECASILCAANFIGRKATCLLYVTDIINKTSPYEISDTTALQKIQNAQTQITKFLLHDFQS